MTFTTTTSVRIAARSGASVVSHELASRVTGAQITTDVRVGDFGTNRATVTLRNDDGELTPGGGGTLGNIDWFSWALLIDTTVTNSTASRRADLFHGIVTNFRLQDDGVNSTVVLEADDGYTVGGSGTTVIDLPGFVGGDLDYWLQVVYNGTGSGSISGVTMPNLGAPGAEAAVSPVGIGDGIYGSTLVTVFYEQTAPARDFVRTVLMPNSPNVAWPTRIDLTTPDVQYLALEANIYPMRSAATAVEFAFAENAGSGELPFTGLERGFPLDTMLNSATVTTIEDQNGNIRSATYTDTTSAARYGTRSFQASQVMPGSPPDAGRLLSAETIAERWANTFSDAEFTVQRLTLTEQMVRGHVGASDDSVLAWVRLLNIDSAPLQVATVEFTPAGTGTTITETVVTMSRTIQVTPSDVRLTVEFLPIDQTGVFVLDSDTLGLLDTNRLG